MVSTMKLPNQVLINFLKSDEFSHFLNTLVTTYTKELLLKVEEVEAQLKLLNKSNKDLMDLLTIKNHNLYAASNGTRNSTSFGSEIFSEYGRSEISLPDLETKSIRTYSQHNSIPDSEIMTRRTSLTASTVDVEDLEERTNNVNTIENNSEESTNNSEVTEPDPPERRNNIATEEKTESEKTETDDFYSAKLKRKDFKSYIFVGISKIDDKRGKLPFEFNGNRFCINLKESQTLGGSQKYLKKCLEAVCPGKYL